MKTYAVYLLNRTKPYIVYGESSDKVSRRWEFHHDFDTPVKVVEVKFDPESGDYIEIEKEG